MKGKGKVGVNAGMEKVEYEPRQTAEREARDVQSDDEVRQNGKIENEVVEPKEAFGAETLVMEYCSSSWDNHSGSANAVDE